MTLLEILCNHITAVYDKQGNELVYKNIKLIMHRSKYSNLKKEIPSLLVDDIIINRGHKITYNCPTCGGGGKPIHLSRFMGKTSMYCRSCKENEPSKRLKHSKWITESYKKHGKVKASVRPPVKVRSIGEIIHSSKEEFELESPEFILKYWGTHCTKNHFENVRCNVVSVGDTPVDKLEYIDVVRIGNQSKYAPKILVDGVLKRFENIVCSCDKCDKMFNSHAINFAQRTRVLCRECSFCNRTFRIRAMNNHAGDKILYQSLLEKKFIDIMGGVGVVVINGPSIPYFWDNKKRKYKVDFFIPGSGIMIEIKARHFWHRTQVESGQWDSKIKAVNFFLENSNEANSYVIIYDTTFEEEITKLKTKLGVG